VRIDNRTLQTVLAVLRSQSDSCYVRPSDGGWQLWCMRPDGATMANVRMSKEAFDTTEDTPEVFVMEIDRWAKALRTMKESVEVDFLDGRVRLSGDGMRHTFRLVAVDQPIERLFRSKDLSSVLTAEVMAETDRIRAFLGAVDVKKTNDLKVVIVPQGLMLQAYDDMENGVDLTISPEDCALLDGSARAMFSCEAWQEIFKVVPPDTAVDIRLGDGKPVVMGFGDKLYEGTWFAAPYIETE